VKPKHSIGRRLKWIFAVLCAVSIGGVLSLRMVALEPAAGEREAQRAAAALAAVDAARSEVDDNDAAVAEQLDDLVRAGRQVEGGEVPDLADARRAIAEADVEFGRIIEDTAQEDATIAAALARHRSEYGNLAREVLSLAQRGRYAEAAGLLPPLQRAAARTYSEFDTRALQQRERLHAAQLAAVAEQKQKRTAANAVLAALALAWTAFGTLLILSVLRPLRHTIDTLRDLNGGIDPALLLRNDELGQVAALLARVRDTMMRLNHLAYRDPVTHLSNRTRFDETVKESIERARRDGCGFAVLFIDLNQFKSINDGFGYAFGDRYLNAVAERLSQLTADHGLLCRYGGDKFALMLDLPQTRQQDRLELFTEASAVATHLLRTMAEPLGFEGHSLTPFVSIGVALFPFDGDSADTLLSAADAALHIAKRNPDGIRFANRDVTDQLRRTLLMAGDIRRGLAAGEIRPFYQPIVNVTTGEVVAVESLVRWQHPTEGLLLPDHFLNVARDTGLFELITDATLEQTFIDAAAWHSRGVEVKVAFNLSAQQLQPGVVERIQERLDRAGLAADRVELEIVETAIMERPEEAAGLLNQLRGLGVHIGLDDFGTGYSSLSYLQRLPIDKIKIPQNFVANLHKTRESEEIIVATLALANSLGYSVVAEGIDNVDQMRRVQALGCPIQQGFLFSSALPADEFEEWMSATRHTRSAATRAA
jgi:diguanylate cyclase (GGDEF)-like protein